MSVYPQGPPPPYGGPGYPSAPPPQYSYGQGNGYPHHGGGYPQQHGQATTVVYAQPQTVHVQERRDTSDETCLLVLLAALCCCCFCAMD